MIQRILQQMLAKRLDFKKAFLIFGPRQVGKTTLAKAFAESLQEDFEYFSGDSIVTRTLWSMSNIEALKQSFGHKKVVILDEAQMIEQVGLICKQLIDAEMGIQFIITGSSSLTIADKTQEPLTGRKWEYFLYPISSEELMAPALPIYDENDSEGGIQNETLKEAYDFLKKGFKYFKKIRQTFYIGRIEAQAIDKSKLVFESSNIKVNPVKIPKDYQRIHER